MLSTRIFRHHLCQCQSLTTPLRTRLTASKTNHPSGLTLMEVLIVAAILAVTATLVGFLVIPNYIHRAHDAKRKSNLDEFRIHFEAYHNDNKVYPPATIMDSQDDCNSDNLQPYLDRIFCDPQTQEPYTYVVSDDGQHYWIYAQLGDPTDPVVAEIGCSAGCGPDTNGDGVRDYNYGISDTVLEGGLIM